MRHFVLLGIVCNMSFSLMALPNPAAVYCDKNGGHHEVETASNGSQYGICSFMEEDPHAIDGVRISQCEEWSFLRGTCKKWDCMVVRELTDVYEDNEVHLFCINEVK